MTPTKQTSQKPKTAKTKKPEGGSKTFHQPCFKENQHHPGGSFVHRTPEGTREEDAEEQAP